MKKIFFIFLFIIQLSLMADSVAAQCSICTKTTQQLGERPAKGLNSGILYLAAAPFAVAAYVGYRWWKTNKGS